MVYVRCISLITFLHFTSSHLFGIHYVLHRLFLKLFFCLFMNCTSVVFPLIFSVLYPCIQNIGTFELLCLRPRVQMQETLQVKNIFFPWCNNGKSWQSLCSWTKCIRRAASHVEVAREEREWMKKVTSSHSKSDKRGLQIIRSRRVKEPGVTPQHHSIYFLQGFIFTSTLQTNIQADKWDQIPFFSSWTDLLLAISTLLFLSNQIFHRITAAIVSRNRRSLISVLLSCQSD